MKPARMTLRVPRPDVPLFAVAILGAAGCVAPAGLSPAAAPRFAPQDSPPAATSTQRGGPATAPAPAPRSQSLFLGPSLRVWGGNFEPEDQSGFTRDTQRYALGIGLSWPHRERIFTLDADLFGTKREFDAVFPISPNPPGPLVAEGEVVTFGLSLGGRATYPVEGPIRFYGGGGLGVYWSELSADGQGANEGFSRSDKNFDPGAYLLAGFDVTVGHLLLGLNYRRWFLESDFSGFNLDNVKLGGDFFGIVIGAAF